MATKTRKLEIPCPTCKGEGFIPIGPAHLAVLKCMGSGYKHTAPELHAALRENVSVGAISNRLEDLRGWGFADRERDGGKYLYFKV